MVYPYDDELDNGITDRLTPESDEYGGVLDRLKNSIPPAPAAEASATGVGFDAGDMPNVDAYAPMELSEEQKAQMRDALTKVGSAGMNAPQPEQISEPSLFDSASEQYQQQQLAGNVGAPAKTRSVASKKSAEEAAIAPSTFAEKQASAETPEDETDVQMRKAQEYQDFMRKMAIIGKAGSRIGAGLAQVGTKQEINPNEKDWEDIAKLGEGPMANIKERISTKTAALELRQKEAEQNPNSPESMVFKQLLKKQYPYLDDKILANLSVFKLKALGLSLKSDDEMAYKKIMADIALGNLKERQKGNVRLEDQLAWKKQQHDELDKSEKNAILTYDNTLGKMKEIKELKPLFNTGPIEGRVTEIESKIGTGGNAAAFKNKLSRALAGYIFDLSGKTVTDAEFKRLSALLPNPNQDTKLFMTNLDEFMKELQSSRSRTLENFRRSGKSVDAMIPENAGINNELAGGTNPANFGKPAPSAGTIHKSLPPGATPIPGKPGLYRTPDGRIFKEQ